MAGIENTWEYVKDPNERLDFTLDLKNLALDSDGLASDEVITAASFTPDPDDGEIEVLQITFSGKKASAMIPGRIAGENYDFTVHVTTLEGTTSREYERTIRLRVRER